MGWQMTTAPDITFQEAAKYARAENWLWGRAYLYQRHRAGEIDTDHYLYIEQEMEAFDRGGASEGQYYQLLREVLSYRKPTYAESITWGAV